jgi:hypothetical protein
MLNRWLFGLSLLALPFGWGATAQLYPADPTPLVALLDAPDVRNPLLSPDGSAIAWTDRDATCVYRFASDATDCTPWPDDTRLNSGRFNQPVWSPDSRSLVMHEDFFTGLNESDLWRFDVARGTYTRLTDDAGVNGSSGFVGLTIDFAPSFHPVTGALYFFRLSSAGQAFGLSDAKIALMELNENGEAEPVRILSPDITGPSSVFLPGAFSEAGTTLYLSVIPEDWAHNPQTGVYALDLRDNRLTQVAALAELQDGLPAESRARFAPMQLQASAAGVVVWMVDGSLTPGPIVRTPVYIDPAGGTVASLVDYGGFEDAAGFAAPLTGQVMPGGQSFWLLAAESPERLSLSALALPPTGAAPEPLVQFSHTPGRHDDPPPTLSEDGKLLLLDVLFTLGAGASAG